MALRTRNGVAIFQQTLLFLHGFTAVDPTFVRTAVGVSVVETPQMTHLAQALHEKQNASDNDGTKNENSNSTHDKNAKPGDDGHVCFPPFWSSLSFSFMILWSSKEEYITPRFSIALTNMEHGNLGVSSCFNPFHLTILISLIRRL
jgi:hypothetical protein